MSVGDGPTKGDSAAAELHRLVHNAVWGNGDIEALDDDTCGLIADDVIEALGSVREQAVRLAALCTDDQLVILRNIWAAEMEARRG